VVGVLTNPLNIVFPSIFILFPLLKKYAKKLDKKELPRTRPTLARIFVDPTLATVQANTYKFVRGWCPHQSTYENNG
jgi:hypothetical protein